MSVAGKYQPRGRTLCQLLERLGSMGQHNRECAVRDSSKAGMQVSVSKIRVVSTDKPYAVSMSMQHNTLIYEDSNARLSLNALVPCRNALFCWKSPMVPVSRHDNYRHSSGRPQLPQECETCRCLV